MSYVDGFVVPVPAANKEAYRDMAARGWEVFRRCGALGIVECWGDDVPAGKLTDFHRAVDARPDEVVVFGWITWPDRASRDAGQKAMMADPGMAAMGDMPFDGKRMIWGGFATIFSAGEGQ